jgi:epidermal growth factor receptor kinase substrate 8
MQHELRTVLLEFRKQRHVEIQKTPDVFINQKSAPHEVKAWLKAKGFSEQIVKTLGGMDGNELFALTKKQFEDICGPSEGRRLDSQITVSRNISGVRTSTSTLRLDLPPFNLSLRLSSSFSSKLLVPQS